MTKVYALHGAVVRSAFEIPAAPGDGDPDLEIVRGDPGPAPEGESLAGFELGELRFRLTRSAGGYRVSYAGSCEAGIDPSLARMTVSSQRGLEALFVQASLLSVWLHLTGAVVLHASAVEVDGRAVAVAGPMGTGKSTAAALLCRDGARVVTDDALRVERDGTCHRGTSELRLREQASSLAFGEERSADGRSIARPSHTPWARLPLGAVVVPHPDRDIDEVSAERLSGAAALVELVSHPRTLGWRDQTVLDRCFRVCASLARALPVYRVRIPWGPPFRDGLGAEILEALRC